MSESTTLFTSSSTSSLRRRSVDTTASSIESSSSSHLKPPPESSLVPPLIHVVDVDAEQHVMQEYRLQPPGQLLDASSLPPLNRMDAVNDNVKQVTQRHVKMEPSVAAALSIRRACRYDCYCKCHSQTLTISSKGLPKINASKHSCTEPNCHVVTKSQDQARGFTSFFRNTLSQVILSRSIKIRYNLNTFRMVSEGSDAIRYVKHGNLEKLKMSFQAGEATLWDTAPDGWSLLHVS